MLKNKALAVIIGVVIVIVLLTGGYILLFGKQPQTEQKQEKQVEAVSTKVEDLKPDDIDLKLDASPDKKKVQFSIGKMSGIKAITYELTYDADPSEQDKAEGGEDIRIPRGITGDAKFKTGESSYMSPWIDLGSCSKNVCKYDKGVTSVNLLLKIVNTNNKVFSTEKNLDL